MSKNTGIMSGAGSMHGIETNTTGTIESADIWYFAYKEGIFVKMVSDGTANSATTTSGERQMSIPATRNYTIVTEVIK